MAKQSAIELVGTIIESLSNAMFRVELENGVQIIATFQARCECITLKFFPATK